MLLRFLQIVPTFRLLFPFLLGVLFLNDQLKFAFSLLFLGLWGLIFFQYTEQKMSSSWPLRWLPGFCYFCIWISLGAFSFGLEQRLAAFPGMESVLIVSMVKIKSAPVEKPRSYQCLVLVSHSNRKEWEGKRLQLYLAKDQRVRALEYGDCLLVKINPRQPSSPKDSKEFDYARWLQIKGICGTAYVSSFNWRLYAKVSPFNWFAAAERMRSVLLLRFNRAGITGNEFSMVSALTLGSSNLLTQETKQQFSTTGVSHILSVSGLHVAVIYAVLEFLLSFFNRFQKLKVIKQLLILVLLWGYAFMTGLSPSVIRSATMFSLLALGGCLQRKTKTINTVLFSAFLLLIWKPSLLFDLGFELSYGAVISIVVVHKRMTELWNPSSKVVRYFWEMICLSAVAQIGTSPLTIFCFHQFPNYFLLNNLVAVPASALIIYEAVAFLFLKDIPIIGTLITWCLSGSLHWFQSFVESMSRIPYALTRDIELHKLEVILWYAWMGSFFIWFFLKRRNWIFAVLCWVLCLQGVALSHHFNLQKSAVHCVMFVNSYLCEKRIPCSQKLLQKT